MLGPHSAITLLDDAGQRVAGIGGGRRDRQLRRRPAPGDDLADAVPRRHRRSRIRRGRAAPHRRADPRHAGGLTGRDRRAGRVVCPRRPARQQRADRDLLHRAGRARDPPRRPARRRPARSGGRPGRRAARRVRPRPADAPAGRGGVRPGAVRPAVGEPRPPPPACRPTRPIGLAILGADTLRLGHVLLRRRGGAAFSPGDLACIRALVAAAQSGVGHAAAMQTYGGELQRLRARTGGLPPRAPRRCRSRWPRRRSCWTPDWHITAANRRAAVLFGEHADDLVGRMLWEAFPDLVATPFEAAVPPRAGTTGTRPRRSSTGCAAAPGWRRGPIRATPAWRSICATSAARPTAQDQQRLAAKMEAIGRLTGGIAHDFNNLLTVVLGNIETLELELPEHGPGATDIREMHDQIRRAAETAAELTRQLLAFARRQPLSPADTDIGRLLHGLDGLLRHTLGASLPAGAAQPGRAVARPHRPAAAGKRHPAGRHQCPRGDAAGRSPDRRGGQSDGAQTGCRCVRRDPARQLRRGLRSPTPAAAFPARPWKNCSIRSSPPSRPVAAAAPASACPRSTASSASRAATSASTSEPGRGTTVRLYIPALGAAPAAARRRRARRGVRRCPAAARPSWSWRTRRWYGTTPPACSAISATPSTPRWTGATPWA